MSPLIKRLPRELKHNLGKYLGIFLLMSVSIALTSGFLLAAHSISVIIERMPAKYNIEDARFTTSFELTAAQRKAAEDAAGDAGGARVIPNFSIDAAFKHASGDDGTKRTLRCYAHRTKVDIAAYAEGRVPRAADEVAVDRVFATNNGLAVGDKVKLSGRTFKIAGIMTQPDSQALFPNNSDFTVNTLIYGVAELAPAGMEALEDAGAAPAYVYAVAFDDASLTVAERTDAEKDMVEALGDADATVTELIDASTNQGIGYAADDVSGDSTMWATLLMIIIALMAFAFVVLTNGTIEEESAIIGTLLASGYRRRELVLHYLLLPSIVGVLAAVVGSVAGVAVFTAPMRDLYYGSYSLPPFEVSWDWSIFAITTLLPVAVLVGITLLGLLRKMGRTPLRFLRHETGGRGGIKRGFALPERLGFVARFRLRVFLRNLGNFATLFLGIAFASMLLLFSLAILPTMTHYASNLHNTLVAEHQYTLKAPLELEGSDSEREAWAAADKLQQVDGAKLSAVEDAANALSDAADEARAAAATATSTMQAEDVAAAQTAATRVAEAQDAFYAALDDVAADLGMSRDDTLDLVKKVQDLDLDGDDVHPVNTQDNGAAIAQTEKYAVASLEYDRGEGQGTETVTVYGVQEGSRYWKDLDVGNGQVVFGGGMVDKFGFEEGQKVALFDKFNDKTYKLTYSGATWGTRSSMNVYLSLDDFNELFGNDADYFNAYASNKALKLDARYFASDLTPDDMDAIGDQFVGMMDDMIGMLVGLSVSIFLIFMYLLTKAVIDRSARSISYMKVFGYTDREISRLYVRSITLVVAVSLVACLPLIVGSLTVVFRAMLMSYSGNIEIYVPPVALAETAGAGFATYLAVAALHLRSIRRVPLAEALKVQE